MNKIALAALLALSVFSFSAQAQYRGESRYQRSQLQTGERVREARVVFVRQVELENSNEMNAGALVGALAGAALGREVGHGRGRQLATGVGVVLGAVAGGKIQRGFTREMGTEIFVDFGNGETVAVLQRGRPPVREGDDVLVTGYGNNMRVVAVSSNYSPRRY